MSITNEPLFGVAYYDEYMPEERLEKDMQMICDAGMNLIRIAESTWATEEPSDGVFDFSHVTRVLDAATAHGLKVIVGTPTYAVPSWLVRKYPDVLAETHNGPGHYGPRQIMDISNEHYRLHAERVIRKLMEAVQGYDCVIGFQVDNETKHYDALGPNVQAAFVEYLKQRFDGDIEAMNQEFGLDYWSNRVCDWADFPDVRNTINASVAGEFEKFRRGMVTEYLAWQAAIVREYARNDQFVTHNFDYEWRGYSFGVQRDVDHFQASACLDVAGVDIYHPTQSALTGAEISFSGDISRSLKGGENYLVLETEAQGNPGWTPYPGQLRLQAYAHYASGADCVEYWHWHSIHNSFETFWKGILSHDLQPNACYREASQIGAELKRIGGSVVGLAKKNRVAFLVSNESLTAMDRFPLDTHGFAPGSVVYNDVFRAFYDEFYRQNCEVDILNPSSMNFGDYDLVVVPCDFCVPEAQLVALNDYVREGGHLLATFKTGFCNEDVKVYHDAQPHVICECLGATYQEFSYVEPQMESSCKWFMELVEPKGAKVLMSYDNPAWSEYAAVTENDFGGGRGFYFGTLPTGEKMHELVAHVLEASGVECGPNAFPVVTKHGKNAAGKDVTYYLNFSASEQSAVCEKGGHELLGEASVAVGEALKLGAWGVAIVES
ncbi:alpha-amylase family protein [Paratractidigestivibacter sp.]|uniref:beta-galactosidase n=1 Tax=Paratractidigestivibacter sp. TaxID=2847316 RepID=UPI002ACB1210|nr:alpha-amylase family protein [Paratractidigestivibacter sp.]